MTTGARRLYDYLFCWGEEPFCGFSITSCLLFDVSPRTFKRWMRELEASGAARIVPVEGEYHAYRLMVLEMQS